MTAPDDLIRRDTAERAIRARQRDTEDSGIYAGLSVALQELAALPADPVAEAAGKLAELLMSDLDESESMGPAAWDEALTAVRAAVAARAKEGES